jgi:hypothetical protein
LGTVVQAASALARPASTQRRLIVCLGSSRSLLCIGEF